MFIYFFFVSVAEAEVWFDLEFFELSATAGKGRSLGKKAFGEFCVKFDHRKKSFGLIEAFERQIARFRAAMKKSNPHDFWSKITQVRPWNFFHKKKLIFSQNAPPLENFLKIKAEGIFRVKGVKKSPKNAVFSDRIGFKRYHAAKGKSYRKRQRKKANKKTKAQISSPA